MERMRCAAVLLAIVWYSAHPGPAAAQDRERDRDRGDTQQRDRRERDDEQTQDENRRLIVPPEDRPDRFRRWRLGVEVEYRDYGAQVTRVERDSPAQREGLETRDAIITVNGYQIGYVNGRLYTLDRELELRADRFGRVRLLVQNRRDGNLANLDVRLDRPDRPNGPPRARPLIGTVTSRQITQLPREALLVVQLVDITNRRTLPIPVAQQTYRDLGPLPIPFELAYDPDRIDPDRSYALQAQVTVNGFAAFRTRDTYPVLSDERQVRVHMVLERAR